jgi:hypothetical protein
MKIRIVTRGGEAFEYDADDQGVGFLEFQVRGQDPEFPAKHWLSDLVSLEVSEHPEPITQTAPEQEAEWIRPPRGEVIFGADTFAKLRELPDYDPRLDEPSDFRYRRVVEPPAKKKTTSAKGN